MIGRGQWLDYRDGEWVRLRSLGHRQVVDAVARKRSDIFLIETPYIILIYTVAFAKSRHQLANRPRMSPKSNYSLTLFSVHSSDRPRKVSTLFISGLLNG